MKISYCPNLSWQEYDGNVYVFNEKTKTVNTFNASAAVFWKAIQDTEDFDSIIEKLMSVFVGVSKEQLMQDFLQFAQVLEKKELIVVEEE